MGNPSGCLEIIDVIVQFSPDAPLHTWSYHANCFCDWNFQLLLVCRLWWRYIDCALHVCHKEISHYQLDAVTLQATCRKLDHLVQHNQSIGLTNGQWGIFWQWDTNTLKHQLTGKGSHHPPQLVVETSNRSAFSGNFDQFLSSSFKYMHITTWSCDQPDYHMLFYITDHSALCIILAFDWFHPTG